MRFLKLGKRLRRVQLSARYQRGRTALCEGGDGFVFAVHAALREGDSEVAPRRDETDFARCDLGCFLVHSPLRALPNVNYPKFKIPHGLGACDEGRNRGGMLERLLSEKLQCLYCLSVCAVSCVSAPRERASSYLMTKFNDNQLTSKHAA